MSQPMIKKTGERPRIQAAYWYVLSCMVFSFFFLVFQGGKLATMLFVIVTILSSYLFLGNWSGIKRTQGVRILANTEQEVRLEAGQSLQVQLQLQIPGIWPIPYILIKDRLLRQNGEEMIFEGSCVPDWKRKGEMIYMTSPLKRGIYKFGSTECVAEDVFGLFQHKGSLALPQQVSVFPQSVDIKEWKQVHQMLKGMQYHSSSTHAHRETTQINGVREYIYGDRLSRIHWNATARTGTWKSKEFERETLPKTVLLLDRTHSAYSNPEQFELAVSIAASLVRFGFSRKLALGLLSIGRDCVYFEPKQSQSQHKQIMNHLVRVEADGIRSLYEVVKQRSRQLPPGSFFVIISPQKDAVMLQNMGWLKQHQINPCLIGVNTDYPKGSKYVLQDEWLKQIHSKGYMGYEVSSLLELPDTLKGAKQNVFSK